MAPQHTIDVYEIMLAFIKDLLALFVFRVVALAVPPPRVVALSQSRPVVHPLAAARVAPFLPLSPSAPLC